MPEQKCCISRQRDYLYDKRNFISFPPQAKRGSASATPSGWVNEAVYTTHMQPFAQSLIFLCFSIGIYLGFNQTH